MAAVQRKPVKWYRVYRNSDDAEVGTRAYGCYSAAQAVGFYINTVLKDKTKMANYYALEVEGPNGWRKPQPATTQAKPAAKPRPRQCELDLSGDEPIDF